MADIFQIDYDQQAPELLPPDKRDAQTITLLQTVMKGIQWCRDRLFGGYKVGATDPNYAAGAYNQFQTVIYEKAVYYSLIDNNTDLPSVTTSWLKVQDNFLGVDERVKFNGQHLVLEYAMNQRFGGTFRPPGSSSNSDIYTTKIAAVVSGFISAATEDFSSSVGQTTSTDKIGLSYPFVQINNFQVNVLASVLAATNEQAIRDFVNLYIPTGLNFIVVGY